MKGYLAPFISAILLFFGSLILWQIKKRRITLKYEIVESDTFPMGENIGQYFIIKLYNLGNTKVEDIELKMNFSNGEISSKNFSDKDLITIKSDTSSELIGQIPYLNPNEIFSSTITVTGKDSIPLPTVKARGSGVTATQKKDYIIPIGVYVTGLGIIGGMLITVIFSLYILFVTQERTSSILQGTDINQYSKQIDKNWDDYFKKLNKSLDKNEEKMNNHIQQMQKRELEYSQGKPNREQIIFAIFNRAGITHCFLNLVGDSNFISYWKTGIFLVQFFLVDKEYREKYILALEMLVKLPEIAPSSKGFNLYLLAKIEQYRGNKEKAIKWFNMCKENTPLMYSHLMIQDPAFDLKKMKSHWIKKR